MNAGEAILGQALGAIESDKPSTYKGKCLVCGEELYDHHSPIQLPDGYVCDTDCLREFINQSDLVDFDQFLSDTRATEAYYWDWFWQNTLTGNEATQYARMAYEVYYALQKERMVRDRKEFICYDMSSEYAAWLCQGQGRKEQ